MDFVALKAELDTDPLGRGYSGMTDQQVSDDINAAYRSRNRTSMTGREIMDAFEGNGSEWDALTQANQDRIIALCGRGSSGIDGGGGLNPFGHDAKVFQDAAAGATNTIAALTAARVETISRADELGLGFVKVGHVEHARTL